MTGKRCVCWGAATITEGQWLLAVVVLLRGAALDQQPAPNGGRHRYFSIYCQTIKMTGKRCVWGGATFTEGQWLLMV